MSIPAVINEEYDIVIAGGGTAACVVASRLAAADTNLRILLLEAGPTTYNNPIEKHYVRGGEPTHGREGPLAVSPGGFLIDLSKQFLQTVRTLDPNHAQKPDDTDTNDLKTINVYTRWLKWINPETGKRSDVPHNMIYPLKDTRPNLHFLTGIHVKHVTFD
ncbi:hypothetical protein V8E53_001771, partial [Lactarius tabidus]